MTLPFPSQLWADRYQAELNACPTYRDAAATWHHGAIAFVIEPDDSYAATKPFCLWLDVDGGTCHAAREVAPDEARAAPFCLRAPYERWKRVIERRLDPVAGMVTRQLVLDGDLLTMLRYVRSAQAMVACATRVPSSFVDEVA